MTIKEKKEWLGSYSRIVREIDTLCEEHERISTMMQKFKDIDEVALQDSINRLQEIVASIDERMAIVVSKRRAIKSVIDSISNEKYRELLYYRYIMGMTHEEIAQKVDKDIRWIFRLFNKALDFVEIPEEEFNEEY